MQRDFLHSGCKISLFKYSKERFKLKIKFRCLIKESASEKCGEQIFQINDLKSGEPIFYYVNRKEEREYESLTFELILPKTGVEISVIPVTETSFGWCVFEVLEEVFLGEYDKVKYAYPNRIFDFHDKCNLRCPACIHGIYGGTKDVMSI